MIIYRVCPKQELELSPKVGIKVEEDPASPHLDGDTYEALNDSNNLKDLSIL